ncbi:hypothetical protein EFA46_015195 (plasmid) [Halarchaeum sp. CBA1220]|uniref:hypothetical protein n=1 Tax=Halarchaeum sp. CBA1220 TaxID=1853682 RepID=UPI0011CDF19E|nr:hypothetical protein [Halarchaeum sp. CBA1220]QLC35573.1 hypothetical protein EFA46_015195 [Halarchaeum sp. CBA1220]
MTVEIFISAAITSKFDRIYIWTRSNVSSEDWSAVLSGLIIGIICALMSSASLFTLSSMGIDVNWFSLAYGPCLGLLLMMLYQWFSAPTGNKVDIAMSTQEAPISDQKTPKNPSVSSTEIQCYECANCGTEFDRDDTNRGDLCPDCESGYLAVDGEEVTLRHD